MNDKKILIILPNLGGGGAERLHVNLANDWILQGFSVDILLLRKEGELIPLLSSKIKLNSINITQIRYSIIPIAIYLLKTKPNVTLTAMWPLTSAVVLAWIITGCIGKLFLSEHVTLISSFIGKTRLKLIYVEFLVKSTYFLSNGIIAVSNAVKKDLMLLSRLKEKKIKVINNPAAIGVSSNKENTIVKSNLWGVGYNYHILSVGRLAVEKDHATLIRSFAILSKKINATLIILGEGNLRQELEKLIVELNLEDRVFLPGFVIDPYPWYRSADLFVLSSLFEGFGNTLVEALECGVPIVCTNCPGGPTEILDNGKYGKLVNIKDIDSLALAMNQSLLSSHDYELLKNRSKDFLVRKISDEYLLYFNLN